MRHTVPVTVQAVHGTVGRVRYGRVRYGRHRGVETDNGCELVCRINFMAAAWVEERSFEGTRPGTPNLNLNPS